MCSVCLSDCVCSCAVAVHTFPLLLPANVASRREGGGRWSSHAGSLHTGIDQRGNKQRKAFQSIFSSSILLFFFSFFFVPFDSDRKQTNARHRDKSIGQGPKATADQTDSKNVSEAVTLLEE